MKTLSEVDPGEVFFIFAEPEEERHLYCRTLDGEHVIELTQRKKGELPGFFPDLLLSLGEGYGSSWEEFAVSPRGQRKVCALQCALTPDAAGHGP